MRKRYDVELSVIWDQPRRAFSIKRAGVPTGRFFAVRAKAIEVATQGLHAKSGHLAVPTDYAVEEFIEVRLAKLERSCLVDGSQS